FVELQTALNTFWKVRKEPGGPIRGFILLRLRSFALVLATGLLLTTLLLASTVLSVLENFIGNEFPYAFIIWDTVNYLVSVGLVTLLFMALYRFVPDVHLRWSHVWVGAVVTAALFAIGKNLITSYLSGGSVTS